ncbi:MAG: efflux RND transporter periplasmic adaptor subunit [Bryobacterales bacterium]|nr:efflux RND transporter periplasmic adaptor subunit [Bryobacterales bacterium]
MRTRINIAGVCALAALALAGCSASKSPSSAAAAALPPAAVRVAKATTRTVPVDWHGIGTVEAFQTITVKAQVGGQLIKVYFKEGDFVKRGQPLFDIQPKPFQMAVAQWEANLARDQALHRQAQANLARDIAQEKFAREQAGRYADLAKQGVFSKEQADQMLTDADAKAEAIRADRAAIDSASASIKADEAALEVARVQLSYCYIKSPIDGRTGVLKVQQGNLVKAIDVELVTIHQVQPILVTFPVPEAQLAEVKRRQAAGDLKVSAQVANDPGSRLTGNLAFIDNSVDATTGTIRLKASFDNAALKFWPGQFVDVILQLSEKRNAVVIPAAAVQIGQDGSFVYVVKADNTAELRPVVASIRSGSDYAIDSGLANGETVITEGHIRVAPGTHLKILP